MISVRNLRKSFRNPDGSTLEVLKGINCDIEPGEIISIIGPSGEGKSTFMRTLNLLDPPTSGEIIVDGQNILDKGYPTHLLRTRIGMVFQHFNLFPHMSVIDNICYAPVRLLKISKEEAREKAMELLRRVGMAEKADVFPDQLSGGQKQRVAIARCLAMNPKAILFDEPTSALDPTMTGEVISVIRQLARDHNITMLIVTHEMKLAREISTRIFFIYKGVIHEDGTPEQIFEHPVHSATKAFVQQIQKQVFDIDGPDFDFYGMYSTINSFCVKYNVPQKADALCHIAEEMSNVILAEHYPLHVVLSISGVSGETTISFMMEGYSSSPLADESVDPIALALVKGISRDMIEEPTAKGYRIRIIV